MTLLLLVLYGPQYWDLSVPTVMIAAAGMILPKFASHWSCWLILTTIQAIGIIPRLYLVDNHKVLMLYWCLALCLCIKNEAMLAFNSRILIGFCFAFAALWKWITPNFLDSSFIHFTLMTDGRFASFSNIAGGVSMEALASNQQSLDSVINGMLAFNNFQDSGAVRLIAVIITAWTLLTESLIALTFLFANKLHWAGKIRNGLLMSFVFLTYPIATVIGFGWLLTIMGYAQSRNEESSSKVCYLYLFIFLQLYLIPWSKVLSTVSD